MYYTISDNDYVYLTNLESSLKFSLPLNITSTKELDNSLILLPEKDYIINRSSPLIRIIRKKDDVVVITLRRDRGVYYDKEKGFIVIDSERDYFHGLNKINSKEYISLSTREKRDMRNEISNIIFRVKSGSLRMCDVTRWNTLKEIYKIPPLGLSVRVSCPVGYLKESIKTFDI